MIIKFKAHSSAVEHCFDVAGVSGSNPLAPTKKLKDDKILGVLIKCN